MSSPFNHDDLQEENHLIGDVVLNPPTISPRLDNKSSRKVFNLHDASCPNFRKQDYFEEKYALAAERKPEHLYEDNGRILPRVHTIMSR